MSDDSDLTCGVKMVAAPDGTQIPVPTGGLGYGGGMIAVSDSAQVEISAGSNNGYYIVINNTDPSNNEAVDLFTELTVEGAITTLEQMATEAFAQIPSLIFKGLGLATGVLVSLFTSSKLTQEIFIRGSMSDGTPLTYCLLT